METEKEKENAAAPASVAGDRPITERAARVASPAAALPPRTVAAPAPAKEVIPSPEASPEDSASDSTEPAAGGGGDDGDGANGAGRGARGGPGAEGPGGHDHHAPAGPMRTHHASAKASLEAGRDWSDCPFPKEARRRTAFVRISVVVDAKGEAIDVKLLNDPGEGFGESAKVCAKRRHYVAGTNDAGEKDATETPPFLVYFTR